MARTKVLKTLGVASWDTIKEDAQSIHMALRTTSSGWQLPAEALELLSTSNKLRHEGNQAAHNASVEEIRDAVQTNQTSLRKHLEKLFKFVFEVDL